MFRRRPAGEADDSQQPSHKSSPVPTVLCGWRWQGLLLLLTLLTTTLATSFYRFLARFSGRRRSWPRLFANSGPPWVLLVLAATSFVHFAEACSSRTTPKPRPPAPPTQRPNITFHTYVCGKNYEEWYCLNGATCFAVKIGEDLLYNCECADGYLGPRCEYKDLDGSYLPSQRRYMLETASIAGGATIAVFLVVILCFVAYVHIQRKAKLSRITTTTDCVDGPTVAIQRVPTFGTRHKHHHHQHQQQHQQMPIPIQIPMVKHFSSGNTNTQTELPLPLSLNDRADGNSRMVMIPTNKKDQFQQVQTLLPPPCAGGSTAGENLA